MATYSEKMEIEELKNMGVGQIFEREKEKKKIKQIESERKQHIKEQNLKD